MKVEGSHHAEPFNKYSIGKEQSLWDEDLIRVDHLMIGHVSSGRKKLDVIALKNPNIILASSATISASRALSGVDFSVLKVPFGPVVGEI